METIFTKIGEHHFQIQSSNAHLFLFFSGDCDQKNDIDMTIKLEGNYGAPFTNFNVDIYHDTNKIYYRRNDYLIEVDSDFKNATVSVHDDFALKHALMSLYSSFIVYHNWGLLIHSSCAIENGKAHIFTGQSGAGKSTVAKLSAPRELLSDEASIIKITSQEIIVYNSPFRSEIEPTDISGPRPLASIQLLNQSLQNKRMKVKKSDALIGLMDKVFFWPHHSEEATRIFGLLKNIVDNVPVYELYFQKNNRFWELISS